MWKDTRIIFIAVFSHDQIFSVIDVVEVMLQTFASGQCKTEWPADYSKCSKNNEYLVWQKDALLWATFFAFLAVFYIVTASIGLAWFKLTTPSRCMLDCVASGLKAVQAKEVRFSIDAVYWHTEQILTEPVIRLLSLSSYLLNWWNSTGNILQHQQRHWFSSFHSKTTATTFLLT